MSSFTETDVSVLLALAFIPLCALKILLLNLKPLILLRDIRLESGLLPIVLLLLIASVLVVEISPVGLISIVRLAIF